MRIGALSIFLYTRGTEGNPPQELRELLRYMEDSCEENATASDLRELHHMVTVVKRDREVGLEYMKILSKNSGLEIVPERRAERKISWKFYLTRAKSLMACGRRS